MASVLSFILSTYHQVFLGLLPQPFPWHHSQLSQQDLLIVISGLFLELLLFLQPPLLLQLFLQYKEN